MAFVDHHQRVVFVGERADLFQLGDMAVHREHAVGDDEPEAGVRRRFQAGLQFVHVGVGVAVALRLAQPHAVDDRGVVERIGNDGVALVQQRLEHAAVGVETGGEQDGVVLVEMRGDLALQRAMLVLRAADEAHRGHAEAVGVERLARRRDHLGMIGEAEIVVGAEIDHLAPGDADAAALRALDQPLALVEPVGLDAGEAGFDVVQ